MTHHGMISVRIEPKSQFFFLVYAGGKVEWGHLAAGDAALNAALHQDGQQYDMIGEEVEALAPAIAQGAGPPMGRGRDAVKPAWMTDNGAAAAPGSGGTLVLSLQLALSMSSCRVQSGVEAAAYV